MVDPRSSIYLAWLVYFSEASGRGIWFYDGAGATRATREDYWAHMSDLG